MYTQDYGKLTDLCIVYTSEDQHCIKENMIETKIGSKYTYSYSNTTCIYLHVLHCCTCLCVAMHVISTY